MGRFPITPRVIVTFGVPATVVAVVDGPSAAAAEVEFTITAAAAGARRGAVEVALLHRALAREVARTAAAKATSRRRARCCRAVAGVVPKLAAGEALHLAVV